MANVDTGEQSPESVIGIGVRIAAMVAALVLVGLGQRVVDTGSAPFDWPALGWLDSYFTDSFGFPSTLSFGVPLFLVGGAVFAIAGARLVTAEPIEWQVAPLTLTKAHAFALAVCAATLLWVIAALWPDHYSPSFRFVFVSAIGIMALLLLARDIRERRLRWKLSWSSLVEIAIVAAIAGTFIGINARDLSHWRYSSIGDEAGFFQLATRILEDSHVNWFSQRDGVGGIHPVLSSVWHAGTMLVFGRDIVGWKMGTLLAIAIALPPYYWLMRELLGKRIAVLGTIFLAASHYLFAYAHTGYDNTFAIFPTVAALACLVSGLKRGSPALLFLAGVFAGLGFYTFHSSRAAIVIMAFVLLSRSDRRAALNATAWLVPAFLLTVLPLFATDGWSVMSASSDQSVLNSNDSLVTHIHQNITRSVLGFSYNPYQLHYTTGALVDTVTLAFAVTGLGLAIARWRDFACQFLIVWFVVAIAIAGVLTMHIEVSISRLHYALPALAAFAALSVDGLATALSSSVRRPWAAPLCTAVAIGALAPTLFILNGRQFFDYSAHRQSTSTVTVVMREVLNPDCDRQPLRDIVYVQNPDPSLDLTFAFYERDDSRPMQVAYRDVSAVYGGNPAWGGTGCLIIGEALTAGGLELTQRFKDQGADVQTVTDVSRLTQNGLVVPATLAKPGPAELASVWNTDFGAGDGLSGVIKGQERDFLPAIDDPRAAPEGIGGSGEPLLVVRITDNIRAYPVQYLMRHGVVNDTLAGTPIAVTYDAISGAARVFDRRVDGRPAKFRVTGFLKSGNALLYDDVTESWWQQLSGRAVTGVHAGAQLTPIPFQLLSDSTFLKTTAETGGTIDIMAPPRGDVEYTVNPYLHYDGTHAKPIFTAGPIDDRLRPLQRVLVVEIDEGRIAVPYPDEGDLRTFSTNVTIGGKQLLLFFDPSAVSELDTRRIFNGRRVGSFAVFEARTDKTFAAAPKGVPFFIDDAGVPWNMLGQPVEGGEQPALVSVSHYTAFWFSASSVFPNIEIAEIDGSD